MSSDGRRRVTSESPWEPAIGFSRAAALADPRWLVEIEAEAVVDRSS